MNRKKITNKLGASMLAIATLAMLVLSCGEEESPKVELPPLAVSPATLTLIIGETGKVGANIAPVTWSSSATNVATVDPSTGEVTTVAVGTATVTATYSGGETADCDVRVVSIPATDITLAPAVVEIWADSTVQIRATPEPDNVTEFNPVWSSSDESVATVSQTGLITGISSGTAVVVATVGSVSKAVQVTVKGYGAILFSSARGYWKFDDASNLGKATRGTDLIYEPATVEIVNGPSATIKAVQMLDREAGFRWDHTVIGEGLTSFTVLIDAWIPLLPDRAYYSVYWNSDSPESSMSLRSRDGDLTVYYRGSTAGSFVAGATAGEEPWTRIVFQYSSDRVFTSYANGAQIYRDRAPLNNNPNDYKLIAGQPVWFLRGPVSGSNNPYKVATIAVWDRLLKPDEIASLGNFNVR